MRWAIGSPEGPRSSVWRLWGNKKGDFYLATRSLGHTLKTSLHRDGNCHTGYTKSYFETLQASPQTPSIRHWDKWRLPEVALVQALKIVVPTQELRAFKSSDDNQIRWIQAPPNDHLTVVTLLVAQMGHELQTMPGAKQGTKPIGIIRTLVRTAWVVYTQHPIDDGMRIDIEKYRAMISTRVPTDKVYGKFGLGTILLGFRDNNERFMIEVASS